MEEQGHMEKERVKQQQESLGKEGLKKKAERLKKANDENEVCTCKWVMANFTSLYYSNGYLISWSTRDLIG